MMMNWSRNKNAIDKQEYLSFQRKRKNLRHKLHPTTCQFANLQTQLSLVKWFAKTRYEHLYMACSSMPLCEVFANNPLQLGYVTNLCCLVSTLLCEQHETMFAIGRELAKYTASVDYCCCCCCFCCRKQTTTLNLESVHEFWYTNARANVQCQRLYNLSAGYNNNNVSLLIYNSLLIDPLSCSIALQNCLSVTFSLCEFLCKMFVYTKRKQIQSGHDLMHIHWCNYATMLLLATCFVSDFLMAFAIDVYAKLA